MIYGIKKYFFNIYDQLMSPPVIVHLTVLISIFFISDNILYVFCIKTCEFVKMCWVTICFYTLVFSLFFCFLRYLKAPKFKCTWFTNWPSIWCRNSFILFVGCKGSVLLNKKSTFECYFFSYLCCNLIEIYVL